MSVDRAETNYTSLYGFSGSQRLLPMTSTALFSDNAHRFFAVRHKLEILSSEGNLPKSWESVLTFCANIQCEVIASSLTARTSESAPAGSIVLRVAPPDFQKLFAQAEKQGHIVRHTTETEDKTSAVVDTEAKLQISGHTEIACGPCSRSRL
jgi:hypothetical protein